MAGALTKLLLSIDGVQQNARGIAPNGISLSEPNNKWLRVIGFEGISIRVENHQAKHRTMKIDAIKGTDLYKLLHNLHLNGLASKIILTQGFPDDSKQVINLEDAVVLKKGDITTTAQGQEGDAVVSFDIDAMMTIDIL